MQDVSGDGSAVPAVGAAVKPVDEEPSRLVDEAMRKAAVAWVSVDDRPAVGLWCLPLDGALYVVSGPGEQPAPGLDEATTAVVILRGDHGGQIVTWPAEVTRVEAGGDEWTTAAPLVAAKRLNAPGSTAELVERWAAECKLHRLAPAGAPLAAGDSLPDGSLAAPARETPAARRADKPFRLHRVRRAGGGS
jgi:hypothetical protein